MPEIELIDLTALCMLVAANSTPVLLAMLFGDRWAQPIDGNRRLADGRPFLGPHKTWRGLIGGTVAAGAAGAALSVGFDVGAAFGLLALTGDLLSSFVKRRLGRSSGQGTLLIDQLPEALLPMLVLSRPLDLSPADIVGTAALFTLFDLVATKLVALGRESSR